MNKWLERNNDHGLLDSQLVILNQLMTTMIASIDKRDDIACVLGDKEWFSFLKTNFFKTLFNYDVFSIAGTVCDYHPDLVSSIREIQELLDAKTDDDIFWTTIITSLDNDMIIFVKEPVEKVVLISLFNKLTSIFNQSRVIHNYKELSQGDFEIVEKFKQILIKMLSILALKISTIEND